MSADSLRRRWFLTLLAVLIFGMAAGSWVAAKTRWAPFAKTELVPLWMASSSGPEVGTEASFSHGFAPVAARALPAVVNVAASKITIASGPSSSELQADPFFRRFFADDLGDQFRPPTGRREHNLGSGVIVSPDGYIITNDHLVSGATEIVVSLQDKRELSARLVGTDPKTDIAVLKVDEKDLPVLMLGDSSQVKVGDFTLAIGNSFGVGQTVTVGIVSATGRGGFKIEDFEDFIQTDAAINPGNSGGALVDVNGNLIGISTAIVSATNGSQGVGFAVPVNMMRHVMEEILRNGKVTRGWLGVTAQSVDRPMARAFGLAGQPRGALINDVTADSPAASAGLAKGDIVLEVDGEAVADARALNLKIAALPPNAVVHLKVTREGKERVLSVELGEMPVAAPAVRAPRVAAETDSGPRLGLSVHPLTPEMAHELGFASPILGVLIDNIQPGSPADEADLQRGDVIEEINGTAITKVEEFQTALRRTRNGQILLLIARGSTHLFVVLEPGMRTG